MSYDGPSPATAAAASLDVALDALERALGSITEIHREDSGWLANECLRIKMHVRLLKWAVEGDKP